jgi:hypothetical protein
MGFMSDQILSPSIPSFTQSRRIKALPPALALILALLVSYGAELSRAQILPASRTIDWTQAGTSGGIPSGNWPIFTTLSASGGVDDSVAIQTALDAAHAAYPNGAVVLLNPGTYTLHRSSTVAYKRSDDYGTGVYECGLILDRSNVVLRGSGPNNTILKYGDGASIISMGTTYLSHSAVVFINVTAGATKGATSLTLASATGITAGSYLVITQTNPADTDGNPLVNISGYAGDSSSGHDLPNTVMSQIDRVTAVTGNVVTLEVPLYISFTNAPKVYRLPNMVEHCGVESLRITSTKNSGTTLCFKNFNLESCGSCWVTNCESDWCVDKSHIYLSDCYRCEIRSNYVYEGYNHNSGSDYAVLLEFRNSSNPIENNIIRRGRHSMIMMGCSGNVWGYNYIVDPYMGEYHNSLPENDIHGAHPFMNLWEGNDSPNLEFDFAHGSNSNNTVFRNYFNLICTNPDTGKPMTSGLWAINLAYYSNYENIVGNALGPYGVTNTASTYQIQAGASQSPAIYKLGFYDDGGTASPNGSLSAKVENTLLRGGNWDANTKTVIWSNNVPKGSLAASYLSAQSIPTSMYKSSRPTWYPSVAVWPPVDPNATTVVNKIPARLCYEAQNLGNGGTFDPTFYGGASVSTGPPAPANLQILSTH